MRAIYSMAACALVLIATAEQVQGGMITNGSFETGDFSGWGIVDLSQPFVSLEVRADGYSPSWGLFFSEATDGNYSATHGFDGIDPGTIRIFQDIGVVDPFTDLLTFDYRVGWLLGIFPGTPMDRNLNLNVYQSGSFGTLLGSHHVMTLPGGTNNTDSGNLSGMIDLSSYHGQAVRISFDAHVPESQTGPAFFQLDDVQLSASSASPVPEPSSLALLGIGIAGIGAARRRRRMKQQDTIA
ncbi:PEP-CTERM motif protein [Maioricimonas rarisocia]|uniref:PEP-CTERM motif protein n=2 Tax=Maioricimonas rarisocia TaxID=2528026 RepID=A0A517Z3E4_9PLAN|nr:PEP-CTERM motif protein [Maioricimonas rarisocia]